MQEIEVPPRDRYAHYVYVDRPGRILLWWFNTKRHNIGFGLYYRPGQVEGARIQAELKADAVDIAEGGSSADAGLPFTQQHASRSTSQLTVTQSHESFDSGRMLRSKSSRQQLNEEPGSDMTTLTPPARPPTKRRMSAVGALASNLFGGKSSQNQATEVSPTAVATVAASVVATAVAGSHSRHVSNASEMIITHALAPTLTQPGTVVVGSPSQSIRSLNITATNNGGNSMTATVAGTRGRQRTTFRPKDPQMKELRPVEVYESSKRTVQGQLVATEVGTYVFIFDNSFSWNTTKRLTFFVAAREATQEAVMNREPDYAGWILKKKRKMMQGWAKRWITIDQGVLSYGKYPHSHCRGSVRIALATISVVPQHRLIHIDSGTSTYHMRAITDEDFNACMSAIRRYKSLTTYAPNEQDATEGADGEASLEGDTTEKAIKQQNRMSMLRPPQTVALATNAEGSHKSTIDIEIENVLVLLNMIQNAQADGATSNEHKMHSSAVSANADKSTPEHEQCLVLNAGQLEKLKASLDIIRRESQQQQNLFKDEQERRLKLEQELQAYHQEMNQLRAQLHLEPLPHIKTDATWTTSGYSSTLHAYSTLDRKSSVRSTASMSSDIFFDAEEDIIVADDADADSDDETGRGTEGGSSDKEHNATFHLSEDDDDDEDEATEEVLDSSTTNGASKTDATNGTTNVSTTDVVPAFERRKRLPAPTCETEISFISLLRKNIGKDLSSVAMPVALNEPINLLQKLCEELEYSELLDQANEKEDSLDRLMYVAAFLVSGYASTQYRSTRKPFNPLHGETYECVRDDKGFRFLAEKVSHNPPIMACHAESKNYIFHQDSKLKSKFWGKSMELTPSGTVHVKLLRWNEHYTYCKPATWMRNMLAGNRYLEHSGEVRVQNHTTGEYCILNFKEGGMFSASTNEVHGTIYNAKGKKERTISGRWTEIMVHERAKNQLEVLWRASPPPPDHASQYGFTQFTIELNELTPDLQVPGILPITDTRFRPDQRAYEEGRVEEADAIKAKLEAEQRQRRQEMEAKGQAWEAQWFELCDDEYSSEKRCWKYKGGYWEARQQRAFPNRLKLW